MENCLYRNVEEKIPNGIGHVCQYACALDLGPNELRDFCTRFSELSYK